jgi:hypothetical protein
MISNRGCRKDRIQRPSCRKMGERQLAASEIFQRKVVKKLWKSSGLNGLVKKNIESG